MQDDITFTRKEKNFFRIFPFLKINLFFIEE